jgi:hypothetical protein
MISDVLAEANSEIDEYLEREMFQEENWPPELWLRIKHCRKIMEETRVMLDTPPKRVE